MTKAELRKIYKAKRDDISTGQNIKWTDLILINFQKIDLPFIDCVHTYLAIDKLKEINTDLIIGYLEFINPGLKISVPKINIKTALMEHFIYHDNIEMVINEFGIAEPLHGERVADTDIDIILIPLLAFDKKGHRVGYGKGFYDRFLQQCKPDALKIGLSFFEAESAIDDIDQFDISLNYCVTPQTVYIF